VQTETPYWLARSYVEPVNQSDTGILARNELNARIVLMVRRLLHLRGPIVDCAGGYGILVRTLRDYGVEAFWADKYCDNLFARGFEYQGGEVGLVTAFEAFEHFVDPSAELKYQLSIAPNVLISTATVPEPTPHPDQWWYYGTDHGQHIGFFRTKTLRYLADKLGKRLVTDGSSYHLFSDRAFGPLNWRAKIFLNRLVSRGLRVASSCSFRSKTWSDSREMAKRQGTR